MLTVLDPVSRRGRELCEALVLAFPELPHRYFHTDDAEQHELAEVAGEARLVPALTDPEELEGSTVVILTAPPAVGVAKRLATWLERAAAPTVVDWSLPPVLSTGTATVFPGRRVDRPEGRRFQVLDPALTGPVRVLKALAPLGMVAAHVTLLTPAADAGDQAAEELATQAVARLNGETPRKPQHLPGILAFDAGLLPTPRREHLAAQLGSLGLPGDIRLAAFGISSFHGHIATLAVQLEGSVKTAAVNAALRRLEELEIVRGDRIGRFSQTLLTGKVRCAELQVRAGLATLVLAYDGSQLAGPGAVAELIAEITAM